MSEAEAFPASRRSALTALSRLALRKLEACEWLAGALDGRLPELAEPALDVAVETGGPIGQVLAELVRRQAGPRLAERLMTRCGERDFLETVPLREVAEAATRKHLLFLYSSLPVRPAAAQLFLLARTLSNLGNRVSRLSDWQESLRYHQEATEIRKELVADGAEAVHVDLAVSLTNVGQIHGALGDWEAALGATQEATQLLRRRNPAHEEAALPALAVSLRNLGIILSELGRHEEALAANREALDIQRGLAAKDPLGFLPALASDLVNSAGRLRELGRGDEALPLMEEALEIRKTLTAERPENFLPALALTFHNLGLLLNEAGRGEEALAATREAARLRRQLADAIPEAFIVDLASSLHNLGNRLADQDRLEEALAVTDEVIRYDLQLLERAPQRFLPDLADRLTHRCKILQRLGRTQDLFEAAEGGLRLLIPHLVSYREALNREVASLFGYYLNASAETDRPRDPEIARGISGR